jgi:Putative adhesin
MQRNRRLATWTGAILGAFLALLLNSALARAWDNDGPVVTEEFHHTYPLAADGRIELENINGAVHITAWDRNEVKVDAVKRAHDDAQLKDIEIRINAHNYSISIGTHYRERNEGGDGEHNNPGSVEYTLTVPRKARLDEIKLINGALEIAGVQGEVRASCINGRLTARGLGGEAKLATINGKLDANFEHPAARLELSSVNGSIDLTLPSDAKASIEANTVHGGIDNDFGLHTNDHRFVGHDLRGELGGGGAEIRLRNVNGTIDIHHASDGRTLSPAKDTGEKQEGSV